MERRGFGMKESVDPEEYEKLRREYYTEEEIQQQKKAIAKMKGK